jgi:MFS family permease
MSREFPAISSGQWSLFTAATSAAAIAGPLITGVLLRWVGRRPLTFVYSVCGTFFWLLFLAVKANTFTLGIVVRSLCGLLNGAISALSPLYLVEISPPESTGFFGTLNQLGISFGWVVCYTAAIPLDSDWRALAGIGAAVPALLAVLVWFIPESPALAELKDAHGPGEHASTICAKKWLWWLFVCGMLMLFQQTTGINIVLMYLTSFFGGDDSGSDFSLLASALSSIAQVIACLFGAFLIERIGRRMMWFVSLLGIGVTDLLYAISRINADQSGERWPNWVVIVIIFVFIFCFGLGAGPIPWFFVPERFPTALRATGMAIIATLNWVFAFVLIEIREVVSHALNQWPAFVAFAVLSFGGAVFGLFFVFNPEKAAKKNQLLVPGIFDQMENA